MIVLHRQAIGDKSPWLLTRLGIDGVRHWTADTGLTELDHVSDGGASIVLTGRVRSDRPQAEWPERMVFVNDATGTPRTLEIATDSMTPATP